MPKNILRLNDLIKQEVFQKAFCPYSPSLIPENYEITISASNIDDIFNALRMLEIKEVKVDFDTMSMIYRYVLANYQAIIYTELDGKLSHDYDKNVLKIIQARTINTFYGVKLHLE